MKKIRIFVDAHVFDDEFQGSRTFIKGIYAALSVRSDIELFIAARNLDNLKNSFPNEKNIVFVKLYTSSSFLRLFFEIPKLIKKLKVDYAHFQYTAPFYCSAKKIVTTHDVLFNDFPNEFSKAYRIVRNFFFGHSARNADILTTVSEYSKHSIRKHLNVNKEIFVTPNGVDSSFLEPYDKRFAQIYIEKHYHLKKYILYVSRFEPRKNHILLLRSYLSLKLYQRGYQLVLLGHKSIESNGFNDLIDSLPDEIKKFIFISGKVSNEHLLYFYQGAEVFVYPSKAEGFGIPPLEAGALGVPVLCSNTTAMSDFNFFGKYHVNPNYEALFTEKLDSILNSVPNVDSINKIRNHIVSNYTWENSADILYQAIIENSKLLSR